MASVELRHWFTLVCALISLLILSSIDLLTLPSWLLAGLIRRHLEWFSKSCLWSFRGINADDMRKINASRNVFAFADKTRNIYVMDINNEMKSIASNLKISNRLDPMNEASAFISLKDHKQDFENHPKCRLINPAKSQLGKVSKSILDNINNEIRAHTKVNEWRNSTDAIFCFQSIDNKQRKSFISFDIADFYPSISEQLLDRAMSWVNQFTNIITDRDVTIIKHTRKSLLFHQNRVWSKRNSDNTFDVTMGSYDGAEVCDLIGLLILNTLQDRFGKDVGLYRDDGLAVINTRFGRLCDRERKELAAVFDNLGLKITAQTNQLRTNFLDLTFDLNNGSYKPYRKPNDDPLCISQFSNHPPPIIRELPHSINRRINTLCCDKETFEEAAPTCNDALTQSNFNAQLKYEQPKTSTSTRNKRQRNVIWYKPPFSKNVKTNIAREFLRLIDKHFSHNNKLHKIFNRHAVRSSYSCSENTKCFISQHNKTILKKHDNQNTTKRKNDSRLSCLCNKIR